MNQRWMTDQFRTWAALEDGGQEFSGEDSPKVTLEYHGGDKIHLSLSAPWLQNPSPSSPSGRLWGLWEHEVVEVFISGPEESYLELEFGPFGHYLALGFRGRRQLVTEDYQINALSFWRDRKGARSPQGEQERPNRGQRLFWGAHCELNLSTLPPPYRAQPSGWGVNAFWCFDSIKTESARFYCCASPLPGSSPNFHQPQYFPKWSPEGLSDTLYQS